MHSKSTIRLPLLLLLAAAITFLPQRAARAGVYTYGATQRTVNAGILLFGAPNKDPYAFYILSQRPDIRPFGWNIVNPLAPKSIASDIKTRWDAIDTMHLYTLGQPVLPSMAAYWEVSLSDASVDDLSQFDVLFLNLNGGSHAFKAADVEKLRRFVDGGGVLWIEDNGGGTVSNTGPLAFPDATLNFSGGGGALSLPNSPERDSLLTTPNALSEQEILNLGVGQAKLNSHKSTLLNPLLRPVLISGSENAISTQILGAGVVVVSSAQVANAINEYVGGVNVYGGNSGAFSGINYAGAPAGDLKLLCNIIASAGAAPHEHQNSHQQGGAANALTAAALSWTFPISDDVPAATAANNGITGSAIYGQIVYITDSGGHLHAFDANPAEDLDGDGNPDDGVADFSSGKPYDQLWEKDCGKYASAPTIAYDPGKDKMAVFVEKKDGSVVEYSAAILPGPAVPYTLGTLFAGAPSPYDNTTGPAPAPTVYEGRLYAGQQNGSLFVLDLVNTVNKATFLVDIDGATAPGEYVSAPPSVGIQTESQRGSDTNDILAYVTTNRGLYTVFCGARGEALTYAAGATPGYNTKLQSLKPSGTAYGRVTGPAGKYRTYTLSAGGLPVGPSLTANSGTFAPPDFSDSVGGTPPTTLADYDLDFFSTAGTVNTDSAYGPFTRTGYSASSQTITPLLPATSKVSAPALDHFGNAFFTVTTPATSTASILSALYCVHDAAATSASTITWRFRLPNAADGPIIDADSTNYSALNDFTFVGAPVTDAQGFVYALAVNGGQTAVLCFNGQQAVTMEVFDPNVALPIASATYTQPVPPGASGGNNEFGETATPLGPQQFLDSDNSGHLTFLNFGSITGMNGHELSPNLSEPQPVTVQYTPSTGAGGTGGSTLTTVVRPLRTNLLWYTVQSGITNPTGLTLVGNRLYFGDGAGRLYKVISDPSTEGIPITNKAIISTATSAEGTPMVSAPVASGLTAIGGTLSAANGVLVVNGTDGVSCFADRTTLVVDANRVMEVDADGQASWVVDSTTQTSTAGGNPQLQDTATASTETGQAVTTDVALNRPSSVTELTPNDYLIADSGNNRAVRFDRSGNVVWELSKFSDATNTMLGKTSSLLASGEPLTLNQPTSVQILRQVDSVTGNILVHYLVADSGNSRIIEVTDAFNSNYGKIADHILTWVSHTGDKQGRSYRYSSASYFYSSSGKRYVIAVVTNKHIADLPNPFTAGTLSPANQDGPGGSLVLLDYDPTGAQPSQKDGYVSSLLTKFTAYLKTSPAADKGRFDVTDSTPLTTLQVRNPRYLKPYTKTLAGGGSEQRFLLADDNGVFDLHLTSGVPPLAATWGFTQADYQAMVGPATSAEVTASAAHPRGSLLFLPTSLQKLAATDTVGGVLISRYLVTTGYSQGEAVHDPAQTALGGEAFETSVDTLGNLSIGGFDGHTLSKPGNTNPLEQPTFAYRLQ